MYLNGRSSLTSEVMNSVYFAMSEVAVTYNIDVALIH